MSTAASVISRLKIPTPFLVGDVFVYVIQGDTNILVDTGPYTEEAWEALCYGLGELSLQPSDIHMVVLTHHHPDHAGLAWKFEETAVIAGHPYTAAWLEKTEAHFDRIRTFYHDLYTSHGMEAEQIERIRRRQEKYRAFSLESSMHRSLKEGDVLPGFPDWRVVYTPGHAQTHVSLMDSTGRTIGGDHLLPHISSNAILEAPQAGEDRPKTLLQYRESLKKFRKASVVYPGHGDIVQDPLPLVEKRLREQITKAARFKEVMNGEPMTAAALTETFYPDMYQKQPDLTFSETLGHLDLLEAQEALYWVETDGVWTAVPR
ncbi:MBL fold metallo-hydrolase [Alkalicoccus chagannorensis]|uniref:MBL fold metallo-hydrolase n=1 Tax=Alkalicoccus chagannorensis TaxID=427072 RepID=UPI000409AE92|nr:MBL fold metallo-hydrolase [Alkalicoccus chagannorensis]